MCDVQRLIDEHLQRNGILQRDAAWEIRKSRHGGRGVFARRDLGEGEVVFADYPLILGPRTRPGEVCVSCYKNEHLQPCSRNCGLPVCSVGCEESATHKVECGKINEWKNDGTEVTKNLLRCLTPIRSLFLDDSGYQLMKNLAAHLNPVHGTEVTILKNKMKLDIPEKEEMIMRMACAVLDANAFEVLVHDEVPTLRGLYPLASLMNHSCSPNTAQVFASKQFMILRTTVPIKKDEEIFISYCRLIWGTLTRRYHLYRTKHFACDCKRCRDPTEFNTYMNSVLCSKCGGNVIPVNPLKSKSEWMCDACGETLPETTIGFITTALAKRLTTLDTDDLAEIIQFYEGRISKIVPENNQIFLEMKYRIIWMIGYKDGYLLSEVSDELLQTKIKFCYEFLKVLKKLEMGECKMRALLLYEILKCEKERTNRNLRDNEEKPFDAEKVLAQIANIFLFDVSAPREIQTYWNKHNVDQDWRNYLKH